MHSIVSRLLSNKLQKSYEIPSQLDIQDDNVLMYLNLQKFMAGDENVVGEEPTIAYVIIDRVEEKDGEVAIVHMSILHEGPTKTLSLPITALTSANANYVYKTPAGEEIRFFISRS